MISLVDDVLTEQMRKHHAGRAGEEYHEIRGGDPDSRARRITEYLNLIDRIVKKQVDAVRRAPFETGSVITRYFEMLPDGELKQNYLKNKLLKLAINLTMLQLNLKMGNINSTLTGLKGILK